MSPENGGEVEAPGQMTVTDLGTGLGDYREARRNSHISQL